MILALVTTLRFFVQERDGISLKQIAALYQNLPVENQAKTSAHRAVEVQEEYLNRNCGFRLNNQDVTNREILRRSCTARSLTRTNLPVLGTPAEVLTAERLRQALRTAEKLTQVKARDDNANAQRTRQAFEGLSAHLGALPGQKRLTGLPAP